MITLSPEHPSFDICMELLASVSTRPIQLRGLAKDFGEPNTKKIMNAVRLVQAGGKIDMVVGHLGRTVRLRYAMSEAIMLRIEAYLDSVYGTSLA